jgi:hypothetical protein
MKYGYVISIVSFLLVNCTTRVTEPDAAQYLSEPAGPVQESSMNEWNEIPGGLHATWGSTDIRYLKYYLPPIATEKQLALQAWRNERINAQFVIWTSDSVENISVIPGSLKSGKSVIPEETINVFLVRNVISDEFLKGCGPREKDPSIARLMPDILESKDVFANPARTSRGIWVSIQVPESAKPGMYTSEININVKGKRSVKLPYTLQVIERAIPDPEHWSFHLDLWQNPYAFKRLYNVELWTEEHFQSMKPLYSMLGNAGQKCITATISHRPWGGQTLDPYDSMIKRVLKADGTWDFDYDIFDRWVSFMMDCGVRRQINCYSMISWDGKYHYTDERDGQEISLDLVPGSDEYNAFWIPFLTSFNRHLETKGLKDITTIAMDERPPELMQAVVDLIREYAPFLKITMATDHKNFNLDEIYDLSIGLKHYTDPGIVKSRKQKGLLTTVYVACQPEYPNTYTFSPPAESAWLGWFASANGLDGILRWAYNSWVEDPLLDSRFRRWPGGDAFMVYPGDRSSVRFEKLREGIQDYEKLRILKESFEGRENHAALFRELDGLLTPYFEVLPDRDSISYNIRKSRILLNSLAEW